MGRQRSVNVRNMERNIMDSVGHGDTHHPTKTHREEDGKVTEGNGKGTQKGGKLNGGKGGNQGEGKVKERKDNVSTKSQNHQKCSGDKLILGTMVITILEF